MIYIGRGNTELAMTPKQEYIVGAIVVGFLLVLGSAIEFGLQINGASIGH